MKVVVGLVILSVFLYGISCQRQYRQGLGRNRNLPRSLQAALRAAHRRTQGADPNAVNPYIPSLPAEHEIECYVEIVTTELRGGRCSRLGNQGQYICQSGAQFDFQPTCNETMRNRQTGSPQPNRYNQSDIGHSGGSTFDSDFDV